MRQSEKRGRIMICAGYDKDWPERIGAGGLTEQSVTMQEGGKSFIELRHRITLGMIGLQMQRAVESRAQLLLRKTKRADWHLSTDASSHLPHSKETSVRGRL
jgi:hypothetical protein